MSKTQTKSVREIKSSGRDNDLQAEILDFIIKNPGLSRREISDKMGLLLNSVTARIKELKDSRLIKESGTKECSATGREVACLWPSIGEEITRVDDIPNKAEIRRVFKLLQKIEKENQHNFKRVLRLIDTYFSQKKSGL